MKKDFVDQLLAKTAQEIFGQINPEYLFLALDYLQAVKLAAESAETLDDFSAKVAFSIAPLRRALGMGKKFKSVEEVAAYYEKIVRARKINPEEARRLEEALHPTAKKQLKGYKVLRESGISSKPVGKGRVLSPTGRKSYQSKEKII